MHQVAKITPEEAMQRYRAVWADYLNEKDNEVRYDLELIMDSLQPSIGSDWIEFQNSLPSYLEHERMLRMPTMPTERDEQGQLFYWGAALVKTDTGVEVQRCKVICLPPVIHPETARRLGIKENQ